MLLSSKYLKICWLALASIFLFKNSFSQNLIQNGSFETSTNNDCYGSFDHHVFPNPHILDNWYNFNSPDYFSKMCPNGPLPNQYGYSVSANIFGYSNAKHGNSYVGLAALPVTGGNSEYIYQVLNSPLQSGKVYCLSFFITRADRKEYALKNIGAYFSISTPTMVSSSYIASTPQIINQTGFIIDTTQWIKIHGCYTAIGGEQYITIGNFNQNSNIDTLYVGTNNPIPSDPKYAYYYIDDVQLWDALTTDIESIDGSKFSVYPNPAKNVLHFEFGNEAQNREVKLYDAIGNLVLTTELNQNKTSLNVSELPNGVYFYSILVKGKVIKNDKVVIIK